MNQHLKNCAILGSVCRGSYDNIDKVSKIVHVVSALCDLQLYKHPIRKHRSWCHLPFMIDYLNKAMLLKFLTVSDAKYEL